MHSFSATACVRWGWETFKKRPWFFIGVTALVGILSAISAGIGDSFGQTGGPAAVANIVSFLLGTFVSLGMVAFFLKAHDHPESVESSELWHPQPFLQYLAAKLLTGVVVVLGFLLLVIPGVILALMFLFSEYLVVDRKLGPLEAMAESKRITSGHKWKLLGLAGLLVLMNLAGLLCLIVGLLVTIPVSALAMVHAYRLLARNAQASTLSRTANA